MIQCDYDIQQVLELSPQDFPVDLTGKGRGGTRFQPPFDYVQAEGIQLDCAVYLTDGWDTVNFQAPDYPVLWCFSEKFNNTYPEFWESKWGKTVEVFAH